MYIIAGLGNPGKKYENTRHNIGFIAVEYLAERYGIKINKIKHKALVGEGMISGQKVLLMKPQTYMNLSGESLRETVKFYKMETEKLIVVYDDIDIPLGMVRIRKKGGPGTHNGMKSVVSCLGTENFPRIRIGMGDKGGNDLVGFVTGGFTKAERKPLEDAVERTCDALESIVVNGIDKAMNEYNIRSKTSGDINE